jgi:hypothetical protein
MGPPAPGAQAPLQQRGGASACGGARPGANAAIAIIGGKGSSAGGGSRHADTGAGALPGVPAAIAAGEAPD